MTLLDSWRSRHSRRLDAAADAVEVDRLVWAWREATAAAGVSHRVDTVTGPTISTPRIVDVTLGPPTVFVARLLAGMLAADVRKAAHRIAPHLGAVSLRVEAAGLGYVRVELLTVDPLAAVVPMRRLPGVRVLVGCDEHGDDITADLAELPHVAVQGQTRSGKTAWTYALLSQVAGRPDVLVAGVDPSGLLLRPFAGSRHAEWQALGLADLERVEAVLRALVAWMDQRITTIPADRDTVATSEAVPLIVVALEEWPATLRALDAADPKAGKRVRSLVARLLAESHKAAIRVVMIAQRAEAGIVGGAERAQLGARLSFRSDNVESVRLLHPAADAELAAGHATAPDGVALMSIPGTPLARIRGPWIGSYAEYVAQVMAAARPR